MKITFYGAAHSFTVSKYLITLDNWCTDFIKLRHISGV